jgi:hypothetical protein
MMLTPALAAAIALVGAPSPPTHAGADTWYLVTVSHGFTEAIFVDLTSITPPQGSTRSALIQAVEAVSLPGAASSLKARANFDCSANTMQVLEATSYDADGQVLNTAPTAEKITPAPGSRGEMEFKVVCADPATLDQSRLIDEGAVGGSIPEYARFMLKGMALDSISGPAGKTKN